jgi:PEP-CTERM motif-containing protein
MKKFALAMAAVVALVAVPSAHATPVLLVPEPGSFGLLAAGLVVLGGAVYFARKRSSREEVR